MGINRILKLGKVLLREEGTRNVLLIFIASLAFIIYFSFDHSTPTAKADSSAENPPAAQEVQAVQEEPEFAKATNGGYAGCLSRELLDQSITAAVQKDVRGFQYLLNNGCVIMKSGLAYSLLDTSWDGVAHIRVYLGNNATEVWTPIENIKNKAKNKTESN